MFTTYTLLVIYTMPYLSHPSPISFRSFTQLNCLQSFFSLYFFFLSLFMTLFFFFFMSPPSFFFFFFFNDPAPPEIYPLPLHDPLPIPRRQTPPGRPSPTPRRSRTGRPSGCEAARCGNGPAERAARE